MGRGGTAPRFLNLDIRWLCLVSFTPSVSLFSVNGNTVTVRRGLERGRHTRSGYSG